jgi:hypothetical protein
MLTDTSGQPLSNEQIIGYIESLHVSLIAAKVRMKPLRHRSIGATYLFSRRRYREAQIAISSSRFGSNKLYRLWLLRRWRWRRRFPSPPPIGNAIDFEEPVDALGEGFGETLT